MRDIFRIIKYSGRLWRLYLAIAALTVIIALLAQATPFLIKMIVDLIVGTDITVEQSFQRVGLLLGLILLSEVGYMLIDNLRGYAGDIMSIRLNRLLAEQYYAHLLQLPQSYFDNEMSGRIISRLNRSVSSISSFFKQFSNNFIQWMLTALVTLIIISFYSWPIALLLGALFPFYFWLTKLSSRDWKEKEMKINATTDYAQGRFAEVIGQVRVVKSFAQEKLEQRLFRRQYDRIEDTTRLQSRRWHFYDIVRRLSLNVVLIFSYAYIVFATIRKDLTIGEFTLLLQLITQVRFPLFASSFIVDNIQRAQADSKDYFDVLKIEPSIADRARAGKLQVSRGMVEFQNVVFEYTKDTAVLKDISFTIPAGKKLALIGQSGEGKTTISNLLLRLYEPTSGSILIDGQDIAGVKQASLHDNVAVVFQDAVLFSGTIRENISYARPRATRAEIEAAAKAANAHSFIMQLPKRYDTEIGERGVKLSGGQKQRIAIARALLKDAPILILDEATSSLDSKSEAEVQKALQRLMRGRTTLIIAHRLSTIRDVDLIISLKNGKVAEIGPPHKLARAGGIYEELLHLQDPTTTNKKKLKKYDMSSI